MTAIQLDDYDYVLPDALIAHEPAATREGSSLMIVRDANHREVVPFVALEDHLQPGDLLVFNNTRVVPGRLQRHRATGGRVEIFVLGPTSGGWDAGPGEVGLHVLARPGRKLKPGERLGDVTLVSRRDDGSWNASADLSTDLLTWLERHGGVPLPPYIVKRRKDLGLPELAERDVERYQTVYASTPGAVAAPTAGLHFSDGLLEKLRERGVKTAFVTLHVGIGTFKPLDEETARGDKLHEEWYEVGPELEAALTAARRVIAVGTTSARALEDQARRFGPRAARPGAWTTQLFIKPGYDFGTVDGLITNFHLPRSSLLVLVSALAGADTIRAAYADAVAKRLRFYSYGDAMLLLRPQ